ncbi:unnamed protein product [Parnassius mnemosyne]|uniref:E3 SUMO-protein ligase NSE2 n=1 Tax=Parnassius mnemosyne TaxID=213953 RepID=A0AAV1M9D1_9NEOP
MADAELTDLRKQCIASLYTCADNVAMFLDGQERETEFSKLKSCIEEYCMLEAQQDVANQALEKAKKETDSSNMDSLQDRFTSHLSNLAGKRLNVNNHPYMLELNNRIEKGRQKATQNLDESDLAITESQEQYIDPITKRPIVDPVKNTVCGHIYEKESIMELINMRKSLKCPVAGCGNRAPLLQQHLISDDELKFRMTLTQHSTMIQERSIMDLDNSLL